MEELLTTVVPILAVVILAGAAVAIINKVLESRRRRAEIRRRLEERPTVLFSPLPRQRMGLSTTPSPVTTAAEDEGDPIVPLVAGFALGQLAGSNQAPVEEERFEGKGGQSGGAGASGTFDPEPEQRVEQVDSPQVDSSPSFDSSPSVDMS